MDGNRASSAPDAQLGCPHAQPMPRHPDGESTSVGGLGLAEACESRRGGSLCREEAIAGAALLVEPIGRAFIDGVLAASLLMVPGAVLWVSLLRE
ncbi:hypothetical protein [Reticulibacter mediterranei]|uniref:hypothetical protein n=1 Tax=Reticulibacter mediterranei TaxID=2778369 RepID=UPI001C693DD2|nr:hypothetical protein [Reticulibacter mediterranei]